PAPCSGTAHPWSRGQPEQGAGRRSNLVTQAERFPRPPRPECFAWIALPEASGHVASSLRDCFVALRAPRNDSRSWAKASRGPGDTSRQRYEIAPSGCAGLAMTAAVEPRLRGFA